MGSAPRHPEFVKGLRNWAAAETTDTPGILARTPGRPGTDPLTHVHDRTAVLTGAPVCTPHAQQLVTPDTCPRLWEWLGRSQNGTLTRLG